MKELQSQINGLPAWVKVLAGIVLFLIGPTGWLIGVGLIVFLNWR